MPSVVSQDLVIKFRRLFRGREGNHGRYWPQPDGGKIVKTVPGPIPDELWAPHLAGTQSFFLGSSPILQDNTCYWACVDWDNNQEDLLAFEAKVRRFNLPFIVCRSKSGGVHLFVFFSEPVPAPLVVEKLKKWRGVLGIDYVTEEKNGKQVKRETEVFPKQVRTKPSDDGNWVNLPYFDHINTNRYAVYRGKQLNLEEFILHAENFRMSEATFQGTGNDTVSPFSDGPPCLETLHAQGWGEGMRNLSLYNIAVTLKMQNPNGWEDDVRQFNAENFDPPLPDSEVEDLIRSHTEHPDYSYKCNDAPIDSVCQKSKCLKRKFGIRGIRDKAANAALPEMQGLVKVLTEPPIWLLNVEGTVVQLDTDDLMQLARFRKVVLERLSIVVPTVRQDLWDEKLRELLTTRIEQAAPQDAGPYGEFVDLFEQFLELRRASKNRDDLLLGKPWEEDGWIFMRGPDLLNFLKRRNFRDFKSQQVWAAVRKYAPGADTEKISLRATKVGVWKIPAMTDVKPEDIPAPKNGRPKF